MSKPVSYLQTDARWKNVDYSAKGESTTIGKAGCGVTCAAMVIASLKDKIVTPITTAQWSKAHGYKALHSGTYYSYFAPQMAVYGISCRQMNVYNNYHSTDQAKLRASVTTRLKQGYWIIACMGKGTWTKSGHYVLAYGISAGGKVLINDPASVAVARTQGTLSTWLDEAKYFWLIDPGVTGSEESNQEVKEEVTRTDVEEIFAVAIKNLLNGDLSDPSDSLKDEWAEAKKRGITDGSRPQGVAKREEVAAMILRAVKAGGESD